MGVETLTVAGDSATDGLSHHRSVGEFVVARSQAQSVVHAAPKARKARRSRLVSKERKKTSYILGVWEGVLGGLHTLLPTEENAYVFATDAGLLWPFPLPCALPVPPFKEFQG